MLYGFWSKDNNYLRNLFWISMEDHESIHVHDWTRSVSTSYIWLYILTRAAPACSSHTFPWPITDWIGLFQSHISTSSKTLLFQPLPQDPVTIYSEMLIWMTIMQLQHILFINRNLWMERTSRNIYNLGMHKITTML